MGKQGKECFKEAGWRKGDAAQLLPTQQEGYPQRREQKIPVTPIFPDGTSGA